MLSRIICNKAVAFHTNPLSETFCWNANGLSICLLLMLLLLFFPKFFSRPSIKIPKYVMMPVAHLVEYTFKVFSRYGMSVPQLTPSRIRLLTCNRTFSCNKAKDQLGYEPIVTLKASLFLAGLSSKITPIHLRNAYYCICRKKICHIAVLRE